MTGRFEGRHVVVTGGTGALGAAVVGQLASEGAVCHVPCVRPEEAARAAFRNDRRVAISMGVELTDEGAVEQFYSGAAKAAGGGGGGQVGLWASIHIAGGFAMGPCIETSKAAFVQQFEMNMLTCFLCSREAVKCFRNTGMGGRIVNVAARPALEPRMGAQMTAYTASKAAVAAFTQALAEEVAGDGVLVNAVVPSIMDTPANRAAMPTADHARWPSVEAVAATVCFLASPSVERGNGVTRGGLVPVYGMA